MGKLRAALTLSPRNWLALAKIWVLLLGIDIALRHLSFPKIQRFAARVKESQIPDRKALAAIKRLQRLVNIAARHHLYTMSCLRQALALQRLLGSQGIETKLRIGVRREADSLDAHAWLEYDGRPIGQLPGLMDRYVILKSEKIE